MRKEQMIKKPTSLAIDKKKSSAFYNRSSIVHDKCLEIEIGLVIGMREGGGVEHCTSQ